jgi:hypothetical protein
MVITGCTMSEQNKIKRFLRIKVAQWHYLVMKGEGYGDYPYTPYKARFYGHFNNLGAASTRIAQCSFQRLTIEFNMKNVMKNINNRDGLEALVIHEVCHIISPRKGDFHGPYFDKKYLKYAKELAPAIDSLVI